MHYFTCIDEYRFSSAELSSVCSLTVTHCVHKGAIHVFITESGLFLASWISLFEQLRLLAVEEHDEKRYILISLFMESLGFS